MSSEQAVFDRVSLSVRHAAAKESTRYAYAGVHLERGGRAVATDGKVLLVVEPSTDKADPLPKAMRPAMPEPVTMSTDTVEVVRKALPKRKQWDTHPRRLFAIQVNGQHEAVTQDSRHTFEPILGDFPAYMDVVPKGEPTAKIRLGVPQLMQILKALKEAGAESFLLELHGHDKPAKISATTHEVRRVWGLIVPRSE